MSSSFFVPLSLRGDFCWIASTCLPTGWGFPRIASAQDQLVDGHKGVPCGTAAYHGTIALPEQRENPAATGGCDGPPKATKTIRRLIRLESIGLDRVVDRAVRGSHACTILGSLKAGTTATS